MNSTGEARPPVRKIKMVRDNIPENLDFETRMLHPTFNRASDAELREHFLDKIVEEALELRKVYNEKTGAFDSAKLVEEFGDLILVINYARDCFGVDDDDLVALAEKKSDKLGQFELGLLMEYDA